MDKEPIKSIRGVVIYSKSDHISKFKSIVNRRVIIVFETDVGLSKAIVCDFHEINLSVWMAIQRVVKLR